MTISASQTNAGDTEIATALSALTESDQGTLFSAQVHKMGTVRGSAGQKIIYGDDTVQVLLWTSFPYHALIARSQKMLNQQLARGGYIERLARNTLEKHSATTLMDVCEALQETRDWFRRVLAGGDDLNQEPEPRESAIWVPLRINGLRVRGSRVYTGVARPGNDRAPVPGTIYVPGVKLGEKLVTPAANPAWVAASQPKTIAKHIIKEQLPVGLYCQYRLEPKRVRNVAVGMEAVRVARQEQIHVDPELLLSLFKVAP